MKRHHLTAVNVNEKLARFLREDKTGKRKLLTYKWYLYSDWIHPSMYLC
jgi:hypothetical protein